MTRMIKRSDLLLTGANFPARTQNTKDLQAAILAAGSALLQPLVVAPSQTEKGKYVVLVGHRRLVATKALGLYPSTLPCNIVDVPEEERDLYMLAANVQKPADLHERLYWVKRLNQQGIGTSKQAKAMGVSVTTIWRLNKLLAAPYSVREAVLCGRLSLRLFEEISTMPAKEMVKALDLATTRKRLDTPITKDGLRNAKRRIKTEAQPERLIGDNKTLAERLNAILALVRAEGTHLPYSNRERAIADTTLPKIEEALGGLKGGNDVS